MRHSPIVFARGQHRRWPYLLVSVMVAFVAVAVVIHHRRYVQASQVAAAASSPVDGFSMGGRPAPGLSLTDQFGRHVTLSQFRGKEVVWALIDDKCTTVCPITAQILTRAENKLGPAAKHVQLLAVNANPLHPSVAAVRAWSSEHAMLHRWEFVTGSPTQLKALYKAYQLAVEGTGKGINGGVIHQSAVIIIDQSGREQLYYQTTLPNQAETVTAQVTGLTRGMQQWLPSGR